MAAGRSITAKVQVTVPDDLPMLYSNFQHVVRTGNELLITLCLVQPAPDVELEDGGTVAAKAQLQVAIPAAMGEGLVRAIASHYGLTVADESAG